MAKKENMELDNVESILYVKIMRSEGDHYYGGYKSDILQNKLTPLEESFLVCDVCKGLMRDACSIDSGQKLKCRPCLKQEDIGVSFGTFNETIEKLSCKCPLSNRGCEWQGVIAEVYKHLDMCQHVIVECSYVKFGCKQISKRLELNKHRGDSKDYHSEIVIVFMGIRVEQLEAENKQQGETITELTKKVEILSKTIKLEGEQQIQKMEDYRKLEIEHNKTIKELKKVENKKVVLSWKIEINSIQDLLSGQVNQYPYDNCTTKQTVMAPGIKGNVYYSPCFIIEPLYYVQSNLTFNSQAENVMLNVQALHAETNIGMIWPLTATIIVSIIGQANKELYCDRKQVTLTSVGSTVQITTIQYNILRNTTGVIEVKIEVERGSINNPQKYYNISPKNTKFKPHFVNPLNENNVNT